jgi:hypothetical protein
MKIKIRQYLYKDGDGNTGISERHPSIEKVLQWTIVPLPITILDEISSTEIEVREEDYLRNFG